MKLITCFDDCLHYVHKLGFAGNGSIAYNQHNLCHVCDLLLSASGQATWYKKEFQPFMVKFRRYTSEHGKTYPWMSRFLVVRNGTKNVLDMLHERHTPYYKVSYCHGYARYNKPTGLLSDPWHTCPQCDNG